MINTVRVVAKSSSKKVTWAQTCRDVGLRLFSSQKYLPTLAFLIIAIALLKAPSDKIPEMFALLVEKSKLALVLGWACAVIIFLSALATIILMRNLYMREISRLATHRDELQEKLNAQAVQHSRLKE